MAYLSDRMRALAASGSPQAAALLDKADDPTKRSPRIRRT